LKNIANRKEDRQLHRTLNSLEDKIFEKKGKSINKSINRLESSDGSSSYLFFNIDIIFDKVHLAGGIKFRLGFKSSNTLALVFISPLTIFDGLHINMAESASPIIRHKYSIFLVILNKLHETSDFLKNILFSSSKNIIVSGIINIPKLIATILLHIAKQSNTMLN